MLDIKSSFSFVIPSLSKGKKKKKRLTLYSACWILKSWDLRLIIIYAVHGNNKIFWIYLGKIIGNHVPWKTGGNRAGGEAWFRASACKPKVLCTLISFIYIYIYIYIYIGLWHKTWWLAKVFLCLKLVKPVRGGYIWFKHWFGGLIFFIIITVKDL
jgi:hypothetical protein